MRSHKNKRKTSVRYLKSSILIYFIVGPQDIPGRPHKKKWETSRDKNWAHFLSFPIPSVFLGTGMSDRVRPLIQLGSTMFIIFSPSSPSNSEKVVSVLDKPEEYFPLFRPKNVYARRWAIKNTIF